ncbi:OmpA family protein, partial [Pseudomonas chlororaphis]
MFFKLKSRHLQAVCLVSLLSVALLEAACADISPSVFAEKYSAAPEVTPAHSQVVYYRLGEPGEKAPAANVYVDQEFHTALLPGGYTAFCVAPGAHGLSAVQNDAPKYQGKYQQASVNLEAGKTLFLRVGEAAGQPSQIVSRNIAEKELANELRQVHMVSRAAAVQDCDYVPRSEEKSYSLSSDVLFGFGRFEPSPAARTAGRQLVAQLRQESSVQAASIVVVGHTDPIGNELANEGLGLRRAQAVRELLVNNGLSPERITAHSVGSREPVTQGCEGGRAALIACHAADRRVVIHVRGQDEV